jgi:hypothetical protein
LAIAEIQGVNSIAEGIGNFSVMAETLLEEAEKAFITFQENTEKVTEAAGKDFDTLTENMEANITIISNDFSELGDEIVTIVGTAITAFTDLGNALSIIKNTYGETAEQIRSDNETVYESFLEILSAQAKVNNLTLGFSREEDYNSNMIKHILEGGDTLDSEFRLWNKERLNKVATPEYSKWASIGHTSQAEAMAIMSIADANN